MNIFGDKLFTPRLCLRRLQEDDLPVLVEWSQTPEAYGKYLTPENLQEDQLRHKLESGILWRSEERLFVIEVRENGNPIGTIHYWKTVSPEKTVVMALKIAIPAERGKGYGTEAQKYLISHLFERAGMEQVLMYTDINNMAQQRCLAKLGFVIVESVVYPDQQVERTGYLYSLDRERYLTQPFYQYHEV